MKATLSIVDELGNRYYGTAELSLAADSAGTDGGVQRPTVEGGPGIHSHSPIRAFVERCAVRRRGARPIYMLLAFSPGDQMLRCAWEETAIQEWES